MKADPSIGVGLVGGAGALLDRFSGPGFRVETVADPAALRRGGAEVASVGPRPDALVWRADTPAALEALLVDPELPRLAFDHAVLVVTATDDARLDAELLRLGVEAIVADGTGSELTRALRHAVERKRVERGARRAYATDPATGLPHEAQLLEHMTQLIALREREPAPMVLLVLRVDGYAEASARLGGEAGVLLRRKVAVRLRSAMRASDVVAALGPQGFGVLLVQLDAKADGERVAAKLVRSLQQPVLVAGQACSVVASVGLAIYPDHGRNAAALLQRAAAQAGGLHTLGGGLLAPALTAAGAGAAQAANDDAAGDAPP